MYHVATVSQALRLSQCDKAWKILRQKLWGERCSHAVSQYVDAYDALFSEWQRSICNKQRNISLNSHFVLPVSVFLAFSFPRLKEICLLREYELNYQGIQWRSAFGFHAAEMDSNIGREYCISTFGPQYALPMVWGLATPCDLREVVCRKVPRNAYLPNCQPTSAYQKNPEANFISDLKWKYYVASLY